MKSSIIKFFASVLLAYLILMPIYFHTAGSYPIFFGRIYGIGVNGTHYYLVGFHEREILDIASNVSNKLNNSQISFVENYPDIGDNIYAFVSSNFVYDSQREYDYKKLRETYYPSYFIEKHSGVCGDFAFLYAAYFLGKSSTATLIVIYPHNSTIGHIFEVENETAYDISVSEPLSKHLANLNRQYSSGKVYFLYLTYNGKNVDISSMKMLLISNKSSIVLPSPVGSTVYIVKSNSTITKYESFPIIIGDTISSGKMFISGLEITPIQNGYVIKADSSKRLTILFDKYTLTTLFYAPITKTVKIRFYNFSLP